MRNPLCSDFSLLQCLCHHSENRSNWHVCFILNFFTWFAAIFFQQGADDNDRYDIRCCYWPPLLGLSWMLTWPSRKQDAHRDTVLRSTTLSPQTSCKALWISVGFFPRKVSVLMYDRWLLREIWLQSVSSSISRLRFAEKGPHSLRVCTQCSLLKSISQLSWKSERLHHPTDHASAVCRTFEMTNVLMFYIIYEYTHRTVLVSLLHLPLTFINVYLNLLYFLDFHFSQFSCKVCYDTHLY